MGGVCDKITNWRGPNRCVPMYGHPASDIAVFVANLFMIGFAIEASLRGVDSNEVCEYPLDSWIAMQCFMMVLLQIIAPLLLIIPEKPNVLSPMMSFALFFAQWIILLIGWVWVFSPSNCSYSAPYLYGGAYWLVVVYTLTIALESVWYGRIYYAFYKNNPNRQMFEVKCDVCSCYA